MSIGLRRRALTALLLGLAATGLVARGQAPLTAAQQTSLATLDRALDRFAGLIAKDDDSAHQTAARGTLDGLRRRRATLLAAFDNSKCEDLKTETILDLQREAAWERSPAPPPTSPAQK